MSPRNKQYRIVDKYLNLQKEKIKKASNGKTQRGNKLKTTKLKSTLSNKKKIFAFYRATGLWPSRKGKTKAERVLGTLFENYMSKESASFDSNLRRIVFASGGRKTNNKRKHDVKGFKEEILAFIEEHGRVPTTHGGETIEGEGKLRHKLDYYTKQGRDMTLLGKVYAMDKCHKSGIPAKYRALINANIDLAKPLIRLV